MLVKQMIYILCFLNFLVSIFYLIYSIKNKNSNISKYIIVSSIIFIIYSFIDILVLPNVLDLNIGLEMLLLNGILAVSVILLIISIIVATKKTKNKTTLDKPLKYKMLFSFIVLFPILLFCFSYFREMNYINNSKLILICSEGDGFSEVNYAYAISDKYSKKITIGADFRGMNMEKHLPSSFWKLTYSWRTDTIEINDNNITILRNNKIIYKIDLADKISYCDVEEVFYK